MYKFFLLICAALLAACEDQQRPAKDEKAVPQSSGTEKRIPANKKETPVASKLNLEISPEMMDAILPDDEGVEDDQKKDALLNIPAKETNDRIIFKGHILLNESEEINKDAVDGAVVEMEIQLE